MQAQNVARAGEVGATTAPSPKKAIAPVPPINPSTPSVRFVALLSATRTNPARGKKRRPKGMDNPNGIAMEVKLSKLGCRLNQ